MTPCGIRNAIPVCFLSAGIAAELGIRPLWCKGVAAGLADAIFTLLRTPPFQLLLIPVIAAQRIQAILLSFNVGVEHPAAALAVYLSDTMIRVFAPHLFLVLLSQVVLVFIFPFVVVDHSHILRIAKNIEGFAYPSITEGMRRLDFFQSFKKILKFFSFLRLASESKRKERYCIYYTGNL